MTYDDLRAAEWLSLTEVRYRYFYDLPDNDRRAELIERTHYAFDCGNDLPLLFEDECNDRLDTINEVLADCTASERLYLKGHSSDLGVRCEAYVSGILPEALARSPRFGERDRQRLSELVDEALLEALPSFV